MTTNTKCMVLSEGEQDGVAEATDERPLEAGLDLRRPLGMIRDLLENGPVGPAECSGADR